MSEVDIKDEIEVVDSIEEMLVKAPGAEVATVESAVPVVSEEEKKLSPEEMQTVETYMSQIDLADSQLVLQYGASAQKSVADFSDGALKGVMTKDMGAIGDDLAKVVTELKGFSAGEEKSGGILGFFKKSANQLTTIKAKYQKAETSVEEVKAELEKHQVVLLKDASMLDTMYEENLSYFKQLTLYIIAGKKKLAQAKEVELPKLLAKASESGLQEDAQAARDYAAMIDRFEKKIYDLELSRNIALQMAPQIRLIQTNDTTMAEKIQSTIVNTIPLWKSQMVIAIGVTHSQEASKAQRDVTDMTNELLKKNAETLKLATIEAAKESERGIVDMETLTQTNQMLIETLDEVMNIQEEGREKRRIAGAELERIEEEVKQKLLEVSDKSGRID